MHHGSSSEKACYERIRVAREICLDGSWVYGYGDGNNAFAAALSIQAKDEDISLQRCILQ